MSEKLKKNVKSSILEQMVLEQSQCISSFFSTKGRYVYEVRVNSVTSSHEFAIHNLTITMLQSRRHYLVNPESAGKL
jgi:hypothetical protein